MTRLLIADDHPLYRTALAEAVRTLLPDARIDEAADMADVHRALETAPDTDLVLLDLHMPGSHGLVGLASLRASHPAVAVAVVSAHEEPQTIRRALDCGAAGYLTKRADMAELKAGLRAVLDCESWVPPDLRDAVARAAQPEPGAEADDIAAKLASLSPQQFRVLERVAEGRLNKQIADELGIQERTVKAHMSAIFEKLGVRNRTQAGVLLSTLTLTDPAQSVEGE
ncbi:MAG: response regulator transcription factor [Rhodanobacteraceae bacterium]|nr:response regulator transcription factor [Xanthomonadales bacterium]MCP5478574.1 response regulator transcription factor [Rhodanobacteraceae bacterium]HPF73211.1 response regulator transcription factor [Xanthomonadaceae bacterium]HRX99900.1 response regulator transcription factor [Xanthomonadaceae bacterium]